jgi:hypothetical protein
VRLLTVVCVVSCAGCASATQVRGWDREDAPEAVVSASPDATPAVAARTAALTPLASSPGAILARQDAMRARAARWAGAGADDAPMAPEVRVTAERDGGSPLAEERRVGSNEQPEWTMQRRFATVRSYVLAPGQIEVEQWMKMHAPRGEGPDHFWQSEIEFGFEGGWQLDLYENYGNDAGGSTKHIGSQVEGRYALAKWGEIPMNPTLYAEYVQNHRAPDKLEFKVLLADETCVPGLHWSTNVFYEQETGGLRGTEIGASGGISYSVLDSKLSVGAECKYERFTEAGIRNNASNELLLGPSFQWRPTENTHVDLVPLCGLSTGDRKDPRFEVYLVLGWNFGPEQKGAHGPVSTSSR